MAKGLWVTEKSGHGEGNKDSEQTNVSCDSQGGESHLCLPLKPGCGTLRPHPQVLPPQLDPHLSCWVMSSSSLR